MNKYGMDAIKNDLAFHNIPRMSVAGGIVIVCFTECEPVSIE